MRKSPLIHNKIEAWKYGPVIPDVYNAFRRQGINIRDEVVIAGQAVSDYDAHLLNEIYRIYGHMPAQKLSDITHEEGSPWQIATERGGWFAPISNEVISSHYQKKRLAAQSNQ